MAARWTAEEHNTLVSLLVDGVSIQSLCDALPSKTEGAIVTRARNKKFDLDFRTSRRDGKLYSGVSRRHHKKKTVSSIKEEVVIVVGEPRTGTTVQEPTIITERTNKNLSVGSIAENSENDAVMAVYHDISELLKCKNYTSVKNITVELANAEFTLHGASHER